MDTELSPHIADLENQQMRNALDLVRELSQKEPIDKGAIIAVIDAGLKRVTG